MNPDVVQAVADLERDGTLSPPTARLLARVARRELVSLHGELRLIAYLGVLLVMAGVGLVVKDNLDRIGPVAIAAALTGGVLVCFAWILRHAPPYARGEAASPHPAFDYVLLLGALLTGADLAYVEAQFTPLGPYWTWHLLLVSLFYGALAFRFDSRVVLSLALSTFAAWRGVSAAALGHTFWQTSEAATVLRLNAVVCGGLFVAAGALLKARDVKAHFEPVAAHLGWLLLILAAPCSGIFERPGGLAYGLALLVVGTALAAGAFWRRRFALFAMGVVAAYVGVSRLVVEALSDSCGSFLFFSWFAFTPIVVILFLYLAHKRLQEPE